MVQASTNLIPFYVVGKNSCYNFETFEGVQIRIGPGNELTYISSLEYGPNSESWKYASFAIPIFSCLLTFDLEAKTVKGTIFFFHKL